MDLDLADLFRRHEGADRAAMEPEPQPRPFAQKYAIAVGAAAALVFLGALIARTGLIS